MIHGKRAPPQHAGPDPKKTSFRGIALTLMLHMTRHVVSEILYEITDSDIPWKLLTHIGNMVICSVEVGALTNVCKKQNFNE